MLEITCYTTEGLEIGTWDIPKDELEIGYCFERMEITEVHPVPRCGSDATVTVEFY